MFLSFKHRQQLKTFLTQVANNEVTRSVNSQLCKKYVKQNIGVILGLFHEIRYF